MKSIYSKDKTIVLLPPEKEFIKQFSKNKRFRKIVWRRKSRFDYVIALNEWDQITILRYLYGIPVLILAAASFLLFLIFIGPYHFINKEKTNKLFDKYMKFLNFFLHQSNHYKSFNLQQHANDIICNKSDKTIYHILYIHESQKDILYQIDQKEVGKHIDQIWIYKHTAELFERIIIEGYQNPFSKIVDYEFIKAHSIWTQQHSVKFVKFNWIGNVDIKNVVFKLSAIPSNSGKIHKPKVPASRITLLPNNILNNEIVFYFERTFNENVNKYISKNYTTINERLSKKGMKLLYIPNLFFQNQFNISQEFESYVAYKYPYLLNDASQTNTNLLKQIFQDTNLQDYYFNIASVLGIPEINNPCFIHSVDKQKEMTADRKFQYSIHEFTNNDIDDIEKEVNHYLELVAIPKDEIYFSVASLNPEDPDDKFKIDGNRINNELTEILNRLKSFSDEKLIIDSLVFLIKTLEKTQPELCRKLNESLFQRIAATNNELSRLYIDEHYRIILLDYNNLEIEMTPLQKTLYIFFLKNKDGVKLKELSSFRKELIDIYCTVGNRLDMDQVKKSIYDLTDARSNSVNEKCSKIKEAFLSKIDDSIANQYYITGYRSENKRIILDRSLVIFHQTK